MKLYVLKFHIQLFSKMVAVACYYLCTELHSLLDKLLCEFMLLNRKML